MAKVNLRFVVVLIAITGILLNSIWACKLGSMRDRYVSRMQPAIKQQNLNIKYIEANNKKVAAMLIQEIPNVLYKN